jgi:PHD/YefM family antitoxin component YafN of YafNO toxin-antitoxin module
VVAERERISVTEASARGVARLAADAAHDAEVVILRRGEPVAAVVSIARLEALDAVRADLRDLALVMGRAVADDGRRLTLDDVRAAYSSAP